MLKLLAIVGLAVVCQGKSLDVGESIFGTYKVVYTWPKWNRPIACSEVIFSEPPSNASVSCECEKPPEKQVLVHEEVKSTQKMEFNLLADVAENFEDLEAVLNNKCVCTPSNRSRTILLKVNGDYLLQYVQGGSRVYLLGKVVPTAERLDILINGFPKLKGTEGTLLCP